jgi:hypothetical protein
MIKDLIRAFDDEDGVNIYGYKFACDFIITTLGAECEKRFRRFIKAQDGKYFLDPYYNTNGIIKEILSGML